MSFAFNEDLLQFIWEQQLFDATELKTLSGEPLIILNQGLQNRNSGPDFEGASIKIGDTLFHGAVEIHLDAKDWNLHKHSNNKSYNNVILHVCYAASFDVLRYDGTPIPTIELKGRIKKTALHQYYDLMQQKSFVPCEALIHSVDNLTQVNWFDRMLLERLEDRCSTFDRFQQKSNGNWNQSFYAAVVSAFGMPINKEPFAELAFELPYELVRKHAESLFQLESLFLGTAGLLNDAFGDDSYAKALLNEYRFLASKYALKTISIPLKTGKMRPMSLPSVKLAQLAALWHYSSNLASTVLSLPDLGQIKALFNYKLSDYWSNHYILGKESAKKDKSLSDAAIHLLLLNSIIPFVFYYEKNKNHSDPTLALAYLSSLKSEKNSIISKWIDLGIRADSAYSSQALLHLYKYYCSNKMCLSCNIGRKILLKEV